MKHRNLWPKRTIFDAEWADRATFGPEFSQFETHKDALLTCLHRLAVSGFDEKMAWSALLRAAYWFFRRSKIHEGTPTAARRKERLVELENASDKLRGYLLKAIQDVVGCDLFRAWCAHTNSPPSIAHGESVKNPLETEIRNLTEGLYKLAAAAGIAAKDIQTKRGTRSGGGLLSLADVRALAAVYRGTTGRNPSLRAGPFAEFVEQFLVATGHSDESSNGYVVEAFLYWHKNFRKEGRQLVVWES